MNSNGLLHFTVNADGRLLLWNSPGEAASTKPVGDVLVVVSLNAYQQRQVRRAEEMAKEQAKRPSAQFHHRPNS